MKRAGRRIPEMCIRDRGNLDGLFDNVNQSVGEIATQVGTTPADWNAGVFSMKMCIRDRDKTDEKKAQRTAPAQEKHRQQDMEL